MADSPLRQWDHQRIESKGLVMGQHRRFPGAVIVLIAVLAIPSLIVGLVNAAGRADMCTAIAQLPAAEKSAEEQRKGVKCY